MSETLATGFKVLSTYTQSITDETNKDAILPNGTVVFTSDSKNLYIHDGKTKGGIQIYTQSQADYRFDPSMKNPDGDVIVGNDSDPNVNHTIIKGKTGQVIINSSKTPALTVNGSTELNGATTINNSLKVTGDSTLSNLTVNGTSTLQGATSINNTLSVTGTTKLKYARFGDFENTTNKVIFDGDTKVNADLIIGDTSHNDRNFRVYGTEIIYGTSNIQGNTKIGTDAVSANLTVTGNSYLRGLTTIGTAANPANLAVNGISYLHGNTTIGYDNNNADLWVNGNSTVTGKSDLRGDTTIGTVNVVDDGLDIVKPASLTVAGGIGVQLSTRTKGGYHNTSRVLNGIYAIKDKDDKDTDHQLVISSGGDETGKGATLYLFPNDSTKIADNTNYSSAGCFAIRCPAIEAKDYPDPTTSYPATENYLSTRILHKLNADGEVEVDAKGIPVANIHQLHWTGELVVTGDVSGLSDRRAKDNIEPIKDALKKVSEIGGYTFTKKADVSGKKYTGCIAQEVQKVLPEAITTDGEYLGLAYGNMVGLLVEAIKELKAEVEELKKSK